MNLQMNIFDVMVYFELYGLSKNVFFFLQIFVTFRNFPILRCKWSKSQPCLDFMVLLQYNRKHVKTEVYNNI